MRFYTGVTDNQWFRFLAALSGEQPVDEVNFWHPGGKAPFKATEPGTPFLFKLKSPNHCIAGFGFYIRYEQLPLSVAWDAFGTGNGARSYQQFLQLISSNRSVSAQSRGDIGCSILGEPVFLPQDLWIPLTDEMPGSVVQGKFFDTDHDDGRRIWDAVQLALAAMPVATTQVAERKVRWGTPVLMRPRLGQGQFRAGITNAYARTCAITGESTLPVLEAAHIRPVSEDGTHTLTNGLLLRSDFHKLFDAGLVTVTPDYTTVVSDQIKARWFNGKAYNTLHGQPLRSLPGRIADRPDPEQLRWHNDHCFERGPLLG